MGKENCVVIIVGRDAHQLAMQMDDVFDQKIVVSSPMAHCDFKSNDCSSNLFDVNDITSVYNRYYSQIVGIIYMDPFVITKDEDNERNLYNVEILLEKIKQLSHPKLWFIHCSFRRGDITNNNGYNNNINLIVKSKYLELFSQYLSVSFPQVYGIFIQDFITQTLRSAISNTLIQIHNTQLDLIYIDDFIRTLHNIVGGASERKFKQRLNEITVNSREEATVYKIISFVICLTESNSPILVLDNPVMDDSKHPVIEQDVEYNVINYTVVPSTDIVKGIALYLEVLLSKDLNFLQSVVTADRKRVDEAKQIIESRLYLMNHTKAYCKTKTTDYPVFSGQFLRTTSIMQYRKPTTLSDLVLDKLQYPACYYNHRLFTQCVQTHTCQCAPVSRGSRLEVYNRMQNPLLSRRSNITSLVINSKISLEERVEKLKMNSILTDIGRYATKVLRLPKIYISNDTRMMEGVISNEAISNCRKPCGTFGCFNADYHFSQIIPSNSISSSQYYYITWYEGCLQHWHGRSLTNTSALAYSRALQEIGNNTINTIFFATHDFGACAVMDWSYSRLTASGHNQQMVQFQKSRVFQSMGDFNTNCYDHEKDVVIPPTPPSIHEFWSHFGNLSNVKSIEERQNFVFFRGKVWGDGAALRVKIRHVKFKTISDDHIFLQKNFTEGQTYHSLLNNTKFCLILRGIVGWSYRMVEAITAGCIPVFIIDYFHAPFELLLDWNKFSVTLKENQISKLETVLSSYETEELKQMQVALLKVRNAFLWFKEEKNNNPDMQQNDLNSAGPAYFSLLEVAVKDNIYYKDGKKNNHRR